MILRTFIILFLTLPSAYSQIYAERSGGGPTKMKFPIEFLYSPYNYYEMTTEADTLSTFTGSGMTFRCGIRYGHFEYLGVYETGTQADNLTEGTLTQEKVDLGFGLLINLRLTKTIYMGAGYSMLTSTITDSGSSTLVSELGGSKIYILGGLKKKLFGKVKYFIEGIYNVSGEFSTLDGADSPNPLSIGGFSTYAGLSYLF